MTRRQAKAESTPAFPPRLAWMSPVVRDRVLERAAILHEANPGMSWPEADARALAEEGRAQ